MNKKFIEVLDRLSKEQNREVHANFIKAMISKQTREKFNNIVQFKKPAELLYRTLADKVKDEAS